MNPAGWTYSGPNHLADPNAPLQNPLSVTDLSSPNDASFHPDEAGDPWSNQIPPPPPDVVGGKQPQVQSNHI